jgi:putative transposase
LARKDRPWFSGAKYHITGRGVRRTMLFHDDEDRDKYLALVEEAMIRYGFILHTYCLMTNHVHLQIETTKTPPGTIMRHLNTKYARYFNKKYHHSGHVFDKRYGAELINSSEYELDLSKYIHLNPLKANMVGKLEDYGWSSYRVYVLIEKSSLVSTKQILSYFPEPKVQNYEKYVKSGFTDVTFLESGKIIFSEDERRNDFEC